MPMPVPRSAATLPPGHPLSVAWIVQHDRPGLRDDPEVFRTHWSVGRRLRVGIPAAWMKSAGIPQWFVSPPANSALEAALARQPAIAIISGVFPNLVGRQPDLYLEYARAFRAAGSRIVMDTGENHFQDFRAPEYRALLMASDGVIANTHGLADVVAQETGRQAWVIPDPVEGIALPPSFEPPQAPGWMGALLGRRPPRPLRLLWFGAQERNFHYLRLLVPSLQALSRECPLELAVVCGPQQGIEKELQDWAAPSPGLRARHGLWSPALLKDELAHCDMVILPSDPAGRMAASANRLVESLRAGRFVIAHGVASYWEYRDAAWIGNDIVAGIRWAVRNPRAVLQRIGLGQQLIETTCAPAVVGPQWQAALTAILQANLAGN